MKWNELNDEQQATAIRHLRAYADGADGTLGEILRAALDELENPTWDDEPAPAHGEIVR